MTKEQAIALKPGDLVYVIDDMRSSALSGMSAQDSPIVNAGLRRAIIGQKNDRYSYPVSISPVTGYLHDFAFARARHIGPEMIFSDPDEALRLFEEYTRKMLESLVRTTESLEQRIIEARGMISQTKDLGAPMLI